MSIFPKKVEYPFKETILEVYIVYLYSIHIIYYILKYYYTLISSNNFKLRIHLQ